MMPGGAMGDLAMAEDTDIDVDAPVADGPIADTPAPQPDDLDQLLAEYTQATAGTDQPVDQSTRAADILAHREGLLGIEMQRLDQAGREIQDAGRQLQVEFDRK